MEGYKVIRVLSISTSVDRNIICFFEFNQYIASADQEVIISYNLSQISALSALLEFVRSSAEGQNVVISPFPKNG